jgi:hypothetical protein
MSLWSTLRTAVQTKAPPAVGPKKSTPRPPSRDPFYSDRPRRAAINARRHQRSSWLGDMSTWWQRGGRRGLDS